MRSERAFTDAMVASSKVTMDEGLEIAKDISTVHEAFGKMLAYTPLAPTACTPGMADAATCDLIARGHTSCKGSRSPIEYSTCMTNFIDATPRNCALSGKADQAALRTVKFNTTAASSNAPRVEQFTLGFAKAFSGNGHFYEFVSGVAVAWKDAKTQAAARNLYGLQGYLATPVTAAENAYIQRLLTGPAWMGACVSSSGSILTSFPGFPRTWYWCAGPEIGQKLCNNSSSGAYTPTGGANGSCTNWSGGEPNNYSGIEGCAAYYSNGMWNDQACDTRATLPGFGVEYGGTSGDPQIVLAGSRNVNFSAK